MKEFDFTQIKHYKLYNFIKAVFRPLVKLVFKAKFKGLENVPQDKGTKYIVAINHTSAIDPIIVACPKELPHRSNKRIACRFQNRVRSLLLPILQSCRLTSQLHSL